MDAPPLLEEVAQVDEGQGELGEACGKGCSRHPLVEHHHQQPVQHTVLHRTQDDDGHRLPGIAVRLDEDLKGVGQQKGGGEGGHKA